MSAWPDDRPYWNVYVAVDQYGNTYAERQPRFVPELELLVEARRPSLRARLRRWLHPDECVCGHAKDAHRHYRQATDCALACDCGRFTRIGRRAL